MTRLRNGAKVVTQNREVAVSHPHYATICRVVRSTRHLLAGMLVLQTAARSLGDVVVIANRTPGAVTFQVTSQTSAPLTASLASGDVRPVFTDEPLRIAFRSGAGRKSYQTDLNCAYYFGATVGGIDLQKIGLREDATTLAGRPLLGSAEKTPVVVFPVKLVVDDEESVRKEIWERRLRSRLDAASAILIQHCGVGFRAVATGTWDSNDQTSDFMESFSELEKEVQRDNAQVVIAFSSQYEVPDGRFHMGGTKGPFHSHIMLREWSRHASENERLELLLHELGHLLGAAHSPEPDSVMRPLLSDRQSRRVGFKIHFDPVNTLAMSLVGEEVRRRQITSFAELTPGTRKRLAQIYAALAPALPQDPAAKQFQQLVSTGAELSLPAATKQVVGAISRAALHNAQQSQADGGRKQGDVLTELYVRAAARSAAELPADIAPKAFVRALGIGLDSTGALTKLPRERSFLTAVESPAERTARVAALGEPTVRGRKDLTAHFAISAYLTASSGPATATAAGLAKEALDAQGASGFSFTDLAADRAGCRFAEGVLVGRFRLPTLATKFTVRDFVPTIDGLPEGLTSAEFLRDFGGTGDERFKVQLREIEQRIDNLVPYQ